MRGLAAIFFLSGATGLVYEVVWARELGFVVGNAAGAQALVLATYMGGLALGNAWLGRQADAVASPWAWYAFRGPGVAALSGS